MDEKKGKKEDKEQFAKALVKTPLTMGLVAEFFRRFNQNRLGEELTKDEIALFDAPRFKAIVHKDFLDKVKVYNAFNLSELYKICLFFRAAKFDLVDLNLLIIKEEVFPAAIPIKGTDLDLLVAPMTTEPEETIRERHKKKEDEDKNGKKE